MSVTLYYAVFVQRLLPSTTGWLPGSDGNGRLLSLSPAVSRTTGITTTFTYRCVFGEINTDSLNYSRHQMCQSDVSMHKSSMNNCSVQGSQRLDYSLVRLAIAACSRFLVCSRLQRAAGRERKSADQKLINCRSDDVMFADNAHEALSVEWRLVASWNLPCAVQMLNVQTYSNYMSTNYCFICNKYVASIDNKMSRLQST